MNTWEHEQELKKEIYKYLEKLIPEWIYFKDKEIWMDYQMIHFEKFMSLYKNVLSSKISQIPKRGISDIPWILKEDVFVAISGNIELSSKE